ncbi:heterogeneous nuclear ribonucleoprotein 1-like [Populus alba x Populus x berolinensis]|nr:heterogeneous nuclear ribonucleoprotein 1-like [Populus alba x Populus x berolinensis]
MSMDYDYPPQERQYGDNVLAFNRHSDEEHQQQQQQQQEGFYEEEQQQQEGDIGSGGIERNLSMNHHHHHHNRDSSSAGKLFVGGVSWETTEETFTNYFSKYGEVMDSVIMTDRHSGRPRGFGFVTFADPAVADRVLEEDHVIDGRAVEVKRTVPREDMDVKGVTRTKKIFVGGIPPSLTEDELKEYFSVYGSIVDHQIMLDHKTGRSRGFGFVTFDIEDAVEQIFSEGRTHELGGKQVEIKKAEPKRTGGDYGSTAKSYTGFSNGAGGFGAGNGAGGFGAGNGASGFGAGNSSVGRYGRKMGRGYGGYGGYDGYGSYGSYGGNYPAGTAGFYGGYGAYGYGFGFGGPMMYGTGVYGGSGYGIPSSYNNAAEYGGGKGYGRTGDGDGDGFGSGKRYDNGDALSGGGYGSNKGYAGSANGSAAVTGRYHPYRK